MESVQQSLLNLSTFRNLTVDENRGAKVQEKRASSFSSSRKVLNFACGLL